MRSLAILLGHFIYGIPMIFRLLKNIIDSILSARQYREGRSFNVEIRTLQDFEAVKKLIELVSCSKL